VANWTLGVSGPDWDLMGARRGAAGGPNVLLLLIDGVGNGDATRTNSG
jgi:hypothetical protein